MYPPCHGGKRWPSEATGSGPAFPFSWGGARFSVLYNTRADAGRLATGACSESTAAWPLLLCLFSVSLTSGKSVHVCGSPAPLEGHMITECENTLKYPPPLKNSKPGADPCEDEAARLHSCRLQACGVRPYAACSCLTRRQLLLHKDFLNYTG